MIAQWPTLFLLEVLLRGYLNYFRCLGVLAWEVDDRDLLFVVGCGRLSALPSLFSEPLLRLWPQTAGTPFFSVSTILAKSYNGILINLVNFILFLCPIFITISYIVVIFKNLLSIQALNNYLECLMMHQMNSKWTKYMPNTSSPRKIRNKRKCLLKAIKENWKEFLWPH